MGHTAECGRRAGRARLQGIARPPPRPTVPPCGKGAAAGARRHAIAPRPARPAAGAPLQWIPTKASGLNAAGRLAMALIELEEGWLERVVLDAKKEYEKLPEWEKEHYHIMLDHQGGACTCPGRPPDGAPLPRGARRPAPPASLMSCLGPGWLEGEVRRAVRECASMPEWEKEHYRRVLGP